MNPNGPTVSNPRQENESSTSKPSEAAASPIGWLRCLMPRSSNPSQSISKLSAKHAPVRAMLFKELGYEVAHRLRFEIARQYPCPVLARVERWLT
jgi:hypothetical protein